MNCRVLFENIHRDLRRGAAAAAAPQIATLVAATGCRILVEARAGHYFERACSVCDDLGVAFFGEVVQKEDGIADRLKMKKLEYDRFLRAIAAARGVRQTFFFWWGGAAFSSRYECTPSVHVSLEVDASYEFCLRNTKDRCLSRSSLDNINLSY